MTCSVVLGAQSKKGKWAGLTILSISVLQVKKKWSEHYGNVTYGPQVISNRSINNASGTV